ncbi:MAG: hypothetical protein CSB13_00220 [Chloroflexi bacterium]|nr:MAG: hypothetical protein CSB13_00220 [Chloroflexota bacterium]
MVTEPELISIIEGLTPEFQPTPQRWLQSIHEGPEDKAIAMCRLRTMSGEDIMERCYQAWDEGRPVKLDYPDELRLRQQADVVAMRLTEVEEGEILLLWVSLDYEIEFEEIDGNDVEGDDDDGFDLF